MNVREWKREDQETVSAIHARTGIDYQMPNLNAEIGLTPTVIESNGALVACGALKLQAEAYLWIEPDLHPAAKWDAIRMVQRELAKKAFRMGVEQIVAYIPERIDKLFKKRLRMLRYERARDGWLAYVFGVKP